VLCEGVKYIVPKQMLEDQGGVCAICFNARFLAVDHDHDTEQVRGLLCEHCNRGLGFFRDSVLALESAIEYLQRRSEMNNRRRRIAKKVRKAGGVRKPGSTPKGHR
jgi:hypothetical protein